ncbi:hypothetical protein [uncultured Eubacterium sp.]|uniref:hypothetical protein n=1 Tax=uncultured Eubacterium sp. TaxID=165185 RepID=UPI002596961B|nr:hypothetical protein [uncultured Eubacterium sp.]
MKITGKINCEKCNSEMKWEYIVPQNVNSRKIEVERINKEIYRPNKITKENNIYTFSMVCNDCGRRNIFQYDSSTN